MVCLVPPKINAEVSGLVGVVTDSTSDIPVALAQNLGIEVIPIYILWQGQTYRDGVEMTPDEFFQRLVSTDVLPTTSQPTQPDFENAYMKLSKRCDSILSIHVSAKLSGTYNASVQAAKSVEDHIPVTVIDSQLNSMGLGLAAIAAARIAAAGGTLKDVVDEARKAISDIKMLGVFDTLKYTIAGGRINKSVGKIASILNIKPLLTFRNGEVHLVGAVRLYRKGVERLANFVRENLPLSEVAIVHSASRAVAEQLKADLSSALPADKIIVNQLGASLGVHGGPGILLVAARRA